MQLLQLAKLIAIVGAVALVAFAFLYVATWSLSHTPRPARPSEMEYLTVSTHGVLPQISRDPAELDITVVVPCFNEEKRLHNLLDSAVPYLKTNFRNSWEILIVDDGSRDGTKEAALVWAANNGVDKQLRYCKFEANRGKGGAVSHGMLSARGRLILFVDADNASEFSCLGDLVKATVPDSERGKPSVAIGSRAHLADGKTQIKRSRVRSLFMHGFHTLVYWFGVQNIKDTQCGFKLFTRDAARTIFSQMHTEGWIFDVEALVIARRRNIPIHEIPISWHEVTGSKIDLARDSIHMAIDLVTMRFAYGFGIYKDEPLEKKII